LEVGPQRQEVEVIGIFNQALGQVGLGWGQGALKVGDRAFLLLQIKLLLNLHQQDIAAPALGDRLLGIPEPFFGGVQGIQQPDVVAPGQVGQGFGESGQFIGVGVGKGPHVAQVAGRKAPAIGEGPAQILGQAIDDLAAPALVRLPLQNVLANPPVQQHQLSIYAEGRLDLGRTNAVLEAGEELIVKRLDRIRAIGHRD
jgi:hypothetical protein